MEQMGEPMGSAKRKEQPSHVHQAVVTGAIEQLRIYGKKGAEVTNNKKVEKLANQEEFDRIYDEKRIAKDIERLRETNEDIVPIDPENPRIPEGFEIEPVDDSAEASTH